MGCAGSTPAGAPVAGAGGASSSPRGAAPDAADAAPPTGDGTSAIPAGEAADVLTALPPPRESVKRSKSAFALVASNIAGSLSDLSALASPRPPAPAASAAHTPGAKDDSQGDADSPNLLMRRATDFKANLSTAWDVGLFEEHYQVGEVLGEGITGEVYLVKHRKTGELFAMKTINTKKVDAHQLDELRTEIALLKTLDHPNTVRLVATYESPSQIIIIMERCEGGDLSKRRFKTEASVRHVICQIVMAVAHMHFHGVAHRDLKLENVLFATKDEDSLVKIVDFGLATLIHRATGDDISSRCNPDELDASERRVMETACGTAYYMAPEMLTRAYAEKVDVWSIGVIAHILLVGCPPFVGANEAEVFRAIKRGAVNYDRPEWRHVSREAKEFVRRLLRPSPKDRPSAAETLELPWLKADVAVLRGRIPLDLGQEVAMSMAKFGKYPKLKQAALMVVAQSIKQDEFKDLQDFFVSVDEDHSGTLSREQVGDILDRYLPADQKLSTQAVDDLFRVLDQSKAGRVSYSDYLASVIELRCKLCNNALLSSAFDHLDADHCGEINHENLRMLLGDRFTSEEINRFIEEADCEHTGIVSRREFVSMMLSAVSPSITPSVKKAPPASPLAIGAAASASASASPRASRSGSGSSKSLLASPARALQAIGSGSSRSILGMLGGASPNAAQSQAGAGATGAGAGAGSNRSVASGARERASPAGTAGAPAVESSISTSSTSTSSSTSASAPASPKIGPQAQAGVSPKSAGKGGASPKLGATSAATVGAGVRPEDLTTGGVLAPRPKLASMNDALATINEVPSMSPSPGGSEESMTAPTPDPRAMMVLPSTPSAGSLKGLAVSGSAAASVTGSAAASPAQDAAGESRPLPPTNGASDAVNAAKTVGTASPGATALAENARGADSRGSDGDASSSSTGAKSLEVPPPLARAQSHADARIPA